MRIYLLPTQDDLSQDYLQDVIILKDLAVTKTLPVPPKSNVSERAMSKTRVNRHLHLVPESLKNDFPERSSR